MKKREPYKITCIAFAVVLTTVLSVGISYAIITPKVKHEAAKTVEYVTRCEQLLITGRLEPICAGYLEYVGYDVETQAVIYSGSPYNPYNAKEKVLAQTRQIGVKPE